VRCSVILCDSVFLFVSQLSQLHRCPLTNHTSARYYQQTGVRRDEAAAQQSEGATPLAKKASLLDPDALASVSEEDASVREKSDPNGAHRRPSFEAELFGDAPSNAAADALLNDKELAGV